MGSGATHVWVVLRPVERKRLQAEEKEGEDWVWGSPTLVSMEDHNKLCVWSPQTGKFLKRREHQTTWPDSWEICMQIKKQQLEQDMEQQIGSKLVKEYIKAVYWHTAYLTYMQSISLEMPGWLKHKLETRLQEKYQ